VQVDRVDLIPRLGLVGFVRGDGSLSASGTAGASKFRSTVALNWTICCPSWACQITPATHPAAYTSTPRTNAIHLFVRTNRQPLLPSVAVS
jgi:hypothetical protein